MDDSEHINSLHKLPLPEAVTQVETAIPVFIGYTHHAGTPDNPLSFSKINDTWIAWPQKIDNIEEYEHYFGKAPAEHLKIIIDDAADPADIKISTQFDIAPVRKMHYHLQLYFANGGGPCYIVSVGTTNNKEVQYSHLIAGIVMAGSCDEATLTVIPQLEGLHEAYASMIYDAALEQAGTLRDRFAIFDCFDNQNPFKIREAIGTGYLNFGAVYHPYLQSTIPLEYDSSAFEIYLKSKNDIQLKFDELSRELQDIVMADIKTLSSVLPPSAAIAGIYAKNDRLRQVWTAPADMKLAMVSEPTIEIDGPGQVKCITDLATGKSINVIRAIPQKGNIVIGARTLASNDRDWKYLSMRRLFNMVETSIKKSTEPFRYEPNNGSTWVQVQAMVENYLMTLWYKGVVQGAVPERAFFVQIGLGETMTQQDIDDGKMIIEVGLAPVLRSEFITFRIVHNMVTPQ